MAISRTSHAHLGVAGLGLSCVWSRGVLSPHAWHTWHTTHAAHTAHWHPLHGALGHVHKRSKVSRALRARCSRSNADLQGCEYTHRAYGTWLLTRRPCTSTPCMLFMASVALASESNVTNPYPRDRPVSRSQMMLAWRVY